MKNKFRKITVDNRDFQWSHMKSGGAFIKDSNGNNYSAKEAYETFNIDGKLSLGTTPRSVAKWISENIFHISYSNHSNQTIKTNNRISLENLPKNNGMFIYVIQKITTIKYETEYYKNEYNTEIKTENVNAFFEKSKADIYLYHLNTTEKLINVNINTLDFKTITIIEFKIEKIPMYD